MDEYDVLVRENVSEGLFSQYLDLLNGLFKSDTVRPVIALAYLTEFFRLCVICDQSRCVWSHSRS